MNYWLVKQEPEKYSFDDLLKEGATDWTGVRNFQARNICAQCEPVTAFCFIIRFRKKRCRHGEKFRARNSRPDR
jgi:predicted RNA-binding protein with PUA-like domain